MNHFFELAQFLLAVVTHRFPHKMITVPVAEKERERASCVHGRQKSVESPTAASSDDRHTCVCASSPVTAEPITHNVLRRPAPVVAA